MVEKNRGVVNHGLPGPVEFGLIEIRATAGKEIKIWRWFPVPPEVFVS